MRNDIIPYIEMCIREGVSLQQGMNYAPARDYSIILMSVRLGAPYRDAVLDEGATLIYEGHDEPRSDEHPNPKSVNQPAETSTGSPTQNGRFYVAAQDFKSGSRPARRVRVYEKIRAGIWSHNGLFDLVDAWKESDGKRLVYKFKLVTAPDVGEPQVRADEVGVHQRVIPTAVKLDVWKRDGGKCVMCGATADLHFDHIIPFSLGGTSLKAENIQILCARHNLAKHNSIE